MVSILQPHIYNLHITSSAGDDFVVHPSSLEYEVVKAEINRSINGLKVHKMRNDAGVIMEGDDIPDDGTSVHVEYFLGGGGFETVTSYPNMLNIKLLCYKCGLKDMPNWFLEWLCEGVCCCLYNNMGVTSWKDCQICCLGPCRITSPSCEVTTKYPVVPCTTCQL